MNGQIPQAEVFDVFLCHHGEDKPHIREIAQKLAAQNIKAWLDEEQIRPGTSWQTALGEQIENIGAAAVFVGESGIGPWQLQEIQALLSQFVARRCPVIPVILPSAKEIPKLPWTLANLHYVDFRATNGTPFDPLRQLIWGITGKKPSEQSQSGNTPEAPSRQTDVKALIPPKDKVHIEIVLPGNVDDFSQTEKDKLLAGIFMLTGVREVRITRALAGSVRLHLEMSPEDADRIYTAARGGQLVALGISEARLYPAIPHPPDKRLRSQLLILLDRVQEGWIDGVLRSSLYNEVQLSLSKHPVQEAIEPRWKQVVELSSQRSQVALKDQNIATIFDMTGLLLILGEPGSGKTTTLLELAENLIDRARSDAKERIPFVLSLSSWKRKHSLKEWIYLELAQRYDVPLRLAEAWLQSDYLIPLLDGLDEVQTALQPDCVAAINAYIDNFKPSGLAVCCRLSEYRWLPNRLKLNGAVCIEPLSREAVNAYLVKGGDKLATLREAVNADSLLKELIKTPLMLSITTLAFQGDGKPDLATHKGDSAEDRRNQIFALYVDEMFRRNGSASTTFPKDKAIHWLSWLAKNMKKMSQSVFLVEWLQPNRLCTRGERAAYGTIAGSSIGLFILMNCMLTGVLIGSLNADPSQGLVAGLLVGLTLGLGTIGLIGLGFLSKLIPEEVDRRALIAGLGGAVIGGAIGMVVPGLGLGTGLGAGLIAGLGVGLISEMAVGPLNRITLVEAMTWNWKAFSDKTIYGLIGAALMMLIMSISGWWIAGWWIDILPIGLGLAIVFGLVPGLICGLTDSVRVGKATPNQGIRLSLKNSLIFLIAILLGLGTIGCAFGAIISKTSYGSRQGLPRDLLVGLIVGVILGSIFGPVIALSRGGSAVIKHYALRLVLWRSGHTPLKFIPFLDYSARLILLKKVGGGYIFIHRMLLEYFAGLAERP